MSFKLNLSNVTTLPTTLSNYTYAILLIDYELTVDRTDNEFPTVSKVCKDVQVAQFFSCQVKLQAPYRMSTLIVAFPWGFATNDSNIMTFQ